MAIRGLASRGGKGTETLRDRLGRAATLALLLSLLSGTVAGALQLLLPDAPSPAAGHAQVVAHGVAPMPAAAVAWRVVLDTADAPEDARSEERALGFALADRGAVGVIDAATGQQSRLAAGEALFVAGGASQTRWSLGAAPSSYYRLALVPGELASDAGGDRLAFAGEQFAAPVGRAFDLDLVRDVLEPREETRLPDVGSPVLVLATVGAIDVGGAGAAPVRLAAGQAVALAGPVVVSGAGSQASVFVAAMIGPEMPEPPLPQTGSVSVAVRACPSDVTLNQAVAAGFAAAAMAGCNPVALDPPPALLLADGQPLPPSEIDSATGAFRWTGLLPSPFPFAAPALPRQYSDWVVIDQAGAVVAASDGSDVAPTVASPGAFTVAAEALEPAGTMYLFEGGSGTIAVRAFGCPPGMTAETLVVEDCEPVDTAPEVQLAGEDGAILTLAQAVGEAGQPQRWEDLPFGAYRLTVAALPSGFDGVLGGGVDYDPATQAFVTTLDAENPERQVALYLTRDGAGTAALSVRLYDCPAGMTRATLAGDFCQAADPSELALSGPEGAASPPGVEGNEAAWENLAPADYVLQVNGLGNEFTDVVASGGVERGAGAFGVTAADGEAAGLSVFRLRPEDAAPIDSDGDGLVDGSEASIGTNSANPDSDGDGRFDGDEVATDRLFQTDPLNPDTDGDGAADGAELAAGSNPTDPASVPGG